MNKPEGIFNNGDLWYGEREEEDGRTWFLAYKPESDATKGADYGTEEAPERFPLFAMTIFPDGTPESFVTEYMLAKKMGDARFGSLCKHERSKRGYCPDCLRKVI
jgi:hypothetical protein